jgi:chromosome segregation ATPase
MVKTASNTEITDLETELEVLRKENGQMRLAQARIELEAQNSTETESQRKLADTQKTVDTLAAGSAKLESQLAAGRKTIESLLMDNNSLRTQVAELKQRVAVDESGGQRDRQELMELSAKHESQLAASRKQIENLSSDNGFIREQYNQASNRAVEEVKKVAILEQQAKTLRSQLSLGLKQRDLHFTAIKAKLAEEHEKMRLQNSFLLEQSRRTDDKIRLNAQRYESVKRENNSFSLERKALEEAIRGLRAKVDAAVRRNERLVDQNQALLAKELGVMQDMDSAEDNDDYKDDGSGSESGSESGTDIDSEVSPGENTGQVRNPDTSSSVAVHNGRYPWPKDDGSEASAEEILLPADLDGSHENVVDRSAGPNLVMVEESFEEIEVVGGDGYRCHIRDTERCLAMFDDLLVSLYCREE